ncbi:hypothetical protein TUM4438_42600 [Shewanella sairae]|uniref:PcfJ domain-containing protein n=2 Tax=Shewanella sairae TaxID=190310 RepID=A0ABQ4PQZ0_9GAMM|nr:hypothetical protein TUM4438_42600 [Shewanella sairae]
MKALTAFMPKSLQPLITSPTVALPIIEGALEQQLEMPIAILPSDPLTSISIAVEAPPEYEPFNRLYEYLLSQDVGYLIKDKTTERERVLAICGMWRMTKTIKTGKLQYHQLKVTYENGEFQSKWIRTKKEWVLPLFTFNINSVYFDEIRNYGLDAILKDLNKSPSLKGFKHKDVNLAINRKTGRGKTYSLLSNKLRYRVSEDNLKLAARSLIRSIWQFIDNRATYRLCYNMYYLRHCGSELTDFHFKFINDFAKHDISIEYWDNNKSLLPLLYLIDDKYYSNEQLFSNKQLISLLSTTNIPLLKNDLRILREQSVTFVKTFCYSIRDFNNSIEGYYNYDVEGLYYQSKAIGEETIKKSLKYFTGFIRSPELMSYPTTIKCKLLILFSNYLFRLSSSSLPLESLQTILTQWAIYHHDMIKNVRPMKHAEQWERVINHCRHVLDWYQHATPLLHKNQTWVSFQQLTDNWDRNRHDAEAQDIEEICWDKQLTQDMTINVKKNTVTISELNTARELHTEGFEQNHCVYSYYHYCLTGNYRVFSLKEFADDGSLVHRLTLGANVCIKTNVLTYEQLQSKGNGLPPPHLKQIAKKMITNLNITV